MSDTGRAIAKLYRARAGVYGLLRAAELKKLAGTSQPTEILTQIYNDLSNAIADLERL